MSQPSTEGVKTGLHLGKGTLCNHPPLGACNGEMVSSLFLLLYLYRQAKERERKKNKCNFKSIHPPEGMRNAEIHLEHVKT